MLARLRRYLLRVWAQYQVLNPLNPAALPSPPFAAAAAPAHRSDVALVQSERQGTCSCALLSWIAGSCGCWGAKLRAAQRSHSSISKCTRAQCDDSQGDWNCRLKVRLLTVGWQASERTSEDLQQQQRPEPSSSAVRRFGPTLLSMFYYRAVPPLARFWAPGCTASVRTEPLSVLRIVQSRCVASP